MSLVNKRNEGHKKRGSGGDEAGPSLFRKSASIDPPGSEVERPHSQQSSKGGGGKKKILSNFLSNLFGNKISENETDPPASTKLSGKKSTSHESVNSVLSSSSFSFVSPKNMKGKQMKGKRIPVDDPNYSSGGGGGGSTSVTNGGNIKSPETPKNKSLGATIDKIGIKIGLKKKYNLQSCESLQYIDACCDEPSSTSTCAAGSSSQGHNSSANGSQSRASLDKTEILPDSPNPVVPSPLVTQVSAECQAITKHFSNPEPEPAKTKLLIGESTQKQSVVLSEVKGVPTKHSQNALPDDQLPSKLVTAAKSSDFTTSILPNPPSNSTKVTTSTPIKEVSSVQLTPVSVQSSTGVPSKPTPLKSQGIVKQRVILESKPKDSVPQPIVISPAAKVEKASLSETIAPINVQPSGRLDSSVASSVDPAAPTSAPPSSVNNSIANGSTKQITTNASSGSTTTQQSAPPAPVASTSSFSQPDAVASTSKGVPSSSGFPPPSSASSSRFAVGCSNTWSNTNRLKRRAPQPPGSFDKPRHRFANGCSPPPTHSANEDLPNDVPSSSSQAAALTKFTKLAEIPNSSSNITYFEIRPRRKERSVEPSPVSRPNSYSVNSYNSSTLFSHHQRFQQHKRSNSDSNNTNTKGRVHKPGKKKAPPPPNPFGDPEADDDTHTADTRNVEEGAGSLAESSTSQVAPVTPVVIIPHDKAKVNEKPPIGKVSTATTPTTNVTQAQSNQSRSTTRTAQQCTSSNVTSTEINPPPNLPQPTPVVTPSISEAPQQTPTESVVSIQSEEQVPSVISPDELEEIRQNFINDQQERQQLGLSQSQASAESSEPLETTVIPTTVTELNVVQPSSSSSSAPTNRNNVPENAVVSARQTLEALSLSVNATRSSESSTTAPDPHAKAKLIQLKKEAEKSPLNASKGKSRPASIGSSIYESPLALLLGRSSGNTTATDQSSAENSPRATPKPWYKRSTSGALVRQFTSKSKQSTSVKPFTSLVKFSELDKEAARIVEENRRKSAEQRFNENAQELIALFSSSFPESSNTTIEEIPESSSSSQQQQQVASPSREVSSPIKVSTSAQVHPSSGETDSSTSNLPSKENVITGKTTTTQQSTPTISASSGVAAGSAQSTATNDSGSSSPPTFLSVHAASKHRQIKPLTTSPITNVRSEKLAIVQPQKSSAVKKSNEETSSIPAQQVRSETNLTSQTLSSSASPSSTTTTTTSPTITATTTALPTTTSNGSPPEITSLSPATTSPSSTQDNNIGGVTNTSSPSSPPASRSINEPQWDCPRCTLKNSNWRILCEVCFHRKDSSTANSYMSSILQRVNAESNKASSNSSPTSTSSREPASPNVTTTNSSGTTSDQPSSRTPINSFSRESARTSNVTTEPTQNTRVVEMGKSDVSRPPPCENFLSQLPAKQDLAKEEKLQGMKLHEDPELEELDIGKLREVRLAYFQRQKSNSFSTAESVEDESVKNPLSTNDLGASCTTAHEEIKLCNSPKVNDEVDVQHHQSQILHSCKPPSATPQTFADCEDDFIDNMLQLENNENTTTVANITDSLPRPSKLPSTPAPTTTSTTSSPSSSVNSNSPIVPFQNRYRPRLEAIREGSSQDYTYCYSSSEIAQIYENWQASEQGSGNKSLVSSPSAISPSLQTFPPQTHLLLEQTPTSTTVHHQHHHHEQPFLRNSNIYPPVSPSSPLLPYSGGNATHVVPLVSADRQPYSNNRHSDSPEENYVNTAVGGGGGVHAPAPPTLNETANFSCAPSPLVCFPSFPIITHNHNVNESHMNNMSRSSGDRHQPYRYGGESSHNYENNMSLAPGGSSSSRRLTYEDYRRMGAIPKGYPLNTSRNDDYSSESSCDTDSSRSFWGRGGAPSGYQDSLHGMTRRGTLDFSQSQDNGFPDPTMAVGKLMKRLEAAITNGDHRLAATLAHDMALLKVNCVVGKINQPFTIRVYVEDRFMQQGPFLIQVSSMMTVQELKLKIESDWGIPAGFQKWILGRKMTEDDNLSLSSYDMAQDSMAFLFLVTPDMGNAPRPGMAPSDNNAKPKNIMPFDSSNQPSTPATLQDTRNMTMNDSGRKSKSPIQENVAPLYNNISNVENGTHAYNNFSFEKPINRSQTPVTASKLRNLSPSPVSNVTAVSCSSSKASSSTQVGHPPAIMPKSVNKEPVVINKEESPPPLPCRSPIQHASKPVECKSQKANGNKNVVKPHSKTSDKSNSSSNSGSLTKSGQQKNTTAKQQNNVIPTGSGKESSNKLSNSISQQRPSPSRDTVSSALTMSLQQKLAEFKAVAEQTFSRAGITPSGKESSPAPAKINNVGVSPEKPKDSKEAKATPRKSGKGNMVQTSSKEKLMNSASSSTEKLTKDEPKRESVKMEVSVPENRFNGVLLPSTNNEIVKPPERSDKSKEKLDVTSKPQPGTSRERLLKTATVPPTEQPKTGSKIDEVVSKKPPVVPVHRTEVLIPTTVYSIGKAEDVAAVPKSNDVEVFKVPNTEQNQEVIPQPKPRGLKKQQSVERVIVSPVEEPVPLAPKPVPRTMAGQKSNASDSKSPEPTCSSSIGATKDSKSPEPGEHLVRTRKGPKSPDTVICLTGGNCASANVIEAGSFMYPKVTELKNVPVAAAAIVTPTPMSTQNTSSQEAVDDYCQTTLPFPAPKYRSPVPTSDIPVVGTTSPTHAQPPPININPGGSVAMQNNDFGKGLLRPSMFLAQSQNSNIANSKIESHTNFATTNVSIYPVKGSGVSSSVLLPLLSSNLSSSANDNFANTTENKSNEGLVGISKVSVSTVHPLPTKPFTSPTAFVAPSPSASNTSTSTTLQQEAAGENGKSKEDNVQSYLKMLELMEKQDLIFTTEDAECPVCFTLIPTGEGIILRDCLHTFCKECLVGCVQYADDSTVKCPYRDNDYACNNNLQEREIKALVPGEIFEKYLARSVKLAESKIVNTFHCKTPDCSGWCVFEDDVNIFLCPVCKKRNCLTCAAIHEGVDCQKYQRELAIAAETDEDAKQSRLMLEKMIQRGEALDCPACHVVLLKKWGCDWVRCSYCKTEICWVTKGFRWGKGGKGDTSGGCKCGVNGVKCHPKCTYCH